MKVVITEEARAESRQRRSWWRAHRDHTELFTEELKRAKAVLQEAPKLAVHGVRDGLEVRRLSLGRIHCYLYYTISEDEDLFSGRG